VSAFVISPFFEKIPKVKLNFPVQCIIAFLLYVVGIGLTPQSSTETTPTEKISSDISHSDTTSTTEISKTTQTETFTQTTKATIPKTTTVSETDTTSTTSTTTTTDTATTQSSKEMALNRALGFIEDEDDGYSYIGLIDILEFAGYSHEDAVYAADNCGADWNQEAVESAENYLSFLDFSSKEDLIEFLTIGGYTTEQAEYAASQFDLKSENEIGTTAVPTPVEVQPEPATLHFILNLESNCIHINAGCTAAQKILPENRVEIDISASDLGSYYQTYWACGKCSKAYSDILPKF